MSCHVKSCGKKIVSAGAYLLTAGKSKGVIKFKLPPKQMSCWQGSLLKHIHNDKKASKYAMVPIQLKTYPYALFILKTIGWG